MTSLIPFLKWLARATSVVSIVLMSLFFIGTTDSIASLHLRDIILMLFFPAGVIAGMVRSWFYPLNGSIISFFSLGMFYALNFYFSGAFPAGPYFLIFTIPALLFFIYRYVTLNVLSKTE
ncbi:MAG TPA: hypothetical protein VI757_11150 [Bacteroidia bacterium]|nr:hypothetical protein [Bacteroidia bacterium]